MTSVPVRRFLKQGGRGGCLLHPRRTTPSERTSRCALLVEAHVDPATCDFNVDVLRGFEVDSEKLASVLATPPMMAEWRVVVVRDVEGSVGESAHA